MASSSSSCRQEPFTGDQYTSIVRYIRRKQVRQFQRDTKFVWSEDLYSALNSYISHGVRNSYERVTNKTGRFQSTRLATEALEFNLQQAQEQTKRLVLTDVNEIRQAIKQDVEREILWIDQSLRIIQAVYKGTLARTRIYADRLSEDKQTRWNAFVCQNAIALVFSSREQFPKTVEQAKFQVQQLEALEEKYNLLSRLQQEFENKERERVLFANPEPTTPTRLYPTLPGPLGTPTPIASQFDLSELETQESPVPERGPRRFSGLVEQLKRINPFGGSPVQPQEQRSARTSSEEPSRNPTKGEKKNHKKLSTKTFSTILTRKTITRKKNPATAMPIATTKGKQATTINRHSTIL